MTVNFSYKAIPNLTLDLNGGHVSKWPPRYKCLNISVLNHLEKKSWCLNINFLGQELQKKTIVNTQILYLTIVAVIVFKNGR